MRLGRWDWAAAGVAFGLALVLRLDRLQPGLLYPDGYQYLLMARGITEHLRPTTVLGPGGELFVPNGDAAAKPLFPALVAAGHVLGLSLLTAARIVTAAAAAGTVVLSGLLTARLGASRAAGIVAGLLVLASPGVVFWSGFAGPDQLGLALGLGSALALVSRRYTTGGVLAGLAACARPELLIVGAAAALAVSMRPKMRPAGARAVLVAVASIVAVLAALRPPLAAPDGILLVGAPLAVAPAVLAFPAGALRRLVAAVAALLAVAAAAAAGLLPGLLDLWRDDWPLLTLALAGFAAAVADRSRRPAAVTTILLGAVLLAVYATKNPNHERYFALLLPVAAVLAGLGVAAVARTRVRAGLAVAGAAAIAAILLPTSSGSSKDMFPTLAGAVREAVPATVPLVTAAPEAYGFWVPTRPVRSLRPGLRGAIVLDAAQRAFAPKLTARGRVVARVASEAVFVGPTGDVDLGAATIVLGTVVRRPSQLR